jgi:hypothetical protein
MGRSTRRRILIVAVVPALGGAFVVANAVNVFFAEEPATLMEEFLEPLMQAMDLYW